MSEIPARFIKIISACEQIAERRFLVDDDADERDQMVKAARQALAELEDGKPHGVLDRIQLPVHVSLRMVAGEHAELQIIKLDTEQRAVGRTVFWVRLNEAGVVEVQGGGPWWPVEEPWAPEVAAGRGGDD